MGLDAVLMALRIDQIDSLSWVLGQIVLALMILLGYSK